MKSGEGCRPLPAKLSESLKRETDQCASIDEKVRTYLPPIDLETPTECVAYEPLTFTAGKTTCTSTAPTVRCNAGCKPTHAVAKTFTFKCNGGGWEDFTADFVVPVTCNNL